MIKIHVPTSSVPDRSLSPLSSWCSQRSNPVYLGYVVRDRTLRGEDQPPENWTWSRQRSHRALVEPSLFWTVHNRRARWGSPTPETDTAGLTEQGREEA